MRRFLVSLLAASMLVPAAASAQDRDFGRGNRERSERSERSDGDRPQRAERQGRSERGERAVRVERSDRADRPERVERAERRLERRMERSEPVREAERVRRMERADDRSINGRRAIAGRQRDGDNVEVRRERLSPEAWRERMVQSSDRSDRQSTTDWSRRVVENGDRADRDRDGRRDWRDRGHRRDWSRDWRRDDRYNWYSYRNRYGSLFRLGRYYDPYGYRYRRFSIGFSLWPSYYRSSFWLNDPWRYRLPPTYGPYRWVRYYDDALLVNIYTGQVVDVVYNVFW